MCASQAKFLEFQAAGDPARPTHGDYFAGKGVGAVRIATPAGPVQVFNTHTCANYAHSYAAAQEGAQWVEATDLDAPVRVAQVLQLARFVRTQSEAVSRLAESLSARARESCRRGPALARVSIVFLTIQTPVLSDMGL